MLGLEGGEEVLELGDRGLDFGVGAVVVLDADLIALDGDVARVEVTDGVNVEDGLVA